MERIIFEYIPETMDEIMKEVDSLCTKYYKEENVEVFKNFNRVYHSLRKIKKGPEDKKLC